MLRWFLLLQLQITESLEATYGSLRVKIAKAVEDPDNILGMEYVKPGVVRFGLFCRVNSRL